MFFTDCRIFIPSLDNFVGILAKLEIKEKLIMSRVRELQ